MSYNPCSAICNSTESSQYHSCWCPGCICRQGISSYDIDPILNMSHVHCILLEIRLPYMHFCNWMHFPHKRSLLRTTLSCNTAARDLLRRSHDISRHKAACALLSVGGRLFPCRRGIVLQFTGKIVSTAPLAGKCNWMQHLMCPCKQARTGPMLPASTQYRPSAGT